MAEAIAGAEAEEVMEDYEDVVNAMRTGATAGVVDIISL
jgi:hypothetical protein